MLLPMLLLLLLLLLLWDLLLQSRSRRTGELKGVVDRLCIYDPPETEGCRCRDREGKGQNEAKPKGQEREKETVKETEGRRACSRAHRGSGTPSSVLLSKLPEALRSRDSNPPL